MEKTNVIKVWESSITRRNQRYQAFAKGYKNLMQKSAIQNKNRNKQ